MPTLSAGEIKGYAKKAGFSGENLDIAVAVALAESGGNTQAHNPVGRDNSYGLWQINMLGKMGFNRRNQFLIEKNEELFDPSKNAEAAYQIWKQQGWERGWTTYARGTYKTHLATAKAASPSDVRNGIDNAVVDAAKELNPVAGVSKAINSFGSTLFKGTTNLAGIGVAIALVLGGIILLVVSSNSAKKAVSVAANVVPGGAVVKGAVKKVAKA
jgi:hypothetical protein